MFREKDPRILVFDSGLGGLSVLSALVETMPFADYIYLADDARFPYGMLTDEQLTDGLVDILSEACKDFNPDLVVIACNTASTVALDALRDVFFIPIVGIVPAIKPAARATRTGKIAVLATPGTIRRSYTRELIREFAGGCSVELIPCSNLAKLAEDYLLDGKRDDAAVRSEITSAFEGSDCRRVDTMVLGCTHYPLLLPILREILPDPVLWINPASAIARRVMHVLSQEWQDCVVNDPAVHLQSTARISFVATGGGEPRLKQAWASIRPHADQA